MNKEQAQSILDKMPVITEPSADDRRAFFSMVNHPGFGVMLGLLLGTRQGLYVQLSRLPIRGNEDRVAVTQGIIQGIEKVSELVVELAIDTQAPGEERN